MTEKLNESFEELKRVDHLIYVSLKYTRTVDVIVNILNRMVDAYSLLVDELITHAVEKGKVSTEPESAVERAELVRNIYGSNDTIADNMGLYLLLRKLLRARNVDRENEYRRHVTMKTVIEGREEIVNIDIITNYYLYQREFFNHVRAIIEGKTDVEVREQELTQPAAPDWMREQRAEVEEEAPRRTSSPASPPPVRTPLKVRPVGAPPRKRAPRPKKYKIQIPKGKNPILSPPFEYDPRFNKELREAQAKAAAAAAKTTAKGARKKSVKAKPKKKAVKKAVKKAKKR